MYDTVEYARSRLDGSIVRLNDGTPVYVSAVGGEDSDIKVSCCKRVGSRNFTKSLSELDLSPVPLGFLNKGDDIVYIARIPKRRDWKQGVRESSVAALDIGASMNDIIDCVNSVYPSPEEAYHSACGGVPKAFHRKWAFLPDIDGKCRLQYMFDVVGTVKVVLGEFNPSFYPGFDYMFSRFLEDVRDAAKAKT